MRMIFHHPLPVRPGAQAASGIRPFQMMEAFRALGYEVDAVCGYADERARAIAEVRRKLAQGVSYDFMYAESSTEPTLLTEPHHLPLHPWLDFGFMAQLKAAGVPMGLFYRDIYWRFPAYGEGLPRWKKASALAMYRYDLFQYRRLLDRLYLPSMEMAPYVPWAESRTLAALPPGHSGGASPSQSAGRGLRLLYVGGLGPHYQMHELFSALHQMPEVEFTLCTREAEWRAVADQYPMPPAGNVKVVHQTGEGLKELFNGIDICMLFVKPHEYWSFAAPVKLYEYIGLHKPIIASIGTLSATVVSNEGIGWTLPYEAPALIALLRALLADRSGLDEKQLTLAAMAPSHSWRARASQVVADLTVRR